MPCSPWACALRWALFILTRPGARAKADANAPLALGNGLLSLTLARDGQSFFRVESAARRGPSIDMTRAMDDPILPRGAFLYFSEEQAGAAPRLWSLGNEPTGRGFGSFTSVSPDRAELKGAIHDLRCEASVEMASGEPVAIWRLRLSNLANAPRKIRIASYRDLVMNEGGVERRDAAYNALHVGTTFRAAARGDFRAQPSAEESVRGFRQQAPVARNRLPRRQPKRRVRLVGYEDVRSRFLGLGQRRDPDAFTRRLLLRDPADEGLLYGFDPCAALLVEIELPPDGVGRTHTG